MSVPSAMSDFPRMLTEQPRHAWPDGVVHHGFRVLLLVGLAVLFHVLFPPTTVPDFPMYELGQVPEQDIYAEVRFPIPKTDAELAAERQEAAAAVAPVFRYDAAAIDSMLSRVRTFFQHVDSAYAEGTTEQERRQRVYHLVSVYGFPVDESAVDLLVSPQQRAELQRSVERAIRGELPAGIASSADYEDSPAQEWRLLRDGTERLLARDSVRLQGHLLRNAAQYLPARTPPGMADFQRLVLQLFFEGSIKLDRQRTEEAREQARATVPVTKGEVLEGERVVVGREQVTEREIERLSAYRQFLTASGALGDGRAHYGTLIGTFMLNLMILSIFGFLLLFYRGSVYRSVRHILLLTTLVATFAGAAAAVGQTGAPVELVPIAFPALVVAALWDGRMALNLALVLAALLSIQEPFMSMSARALILIGGSTAALSVRVVHRRAQGLVLGAVIAFAYALACIALGMLRSRDTMEIAMCVFWGAANGMGSALIAMGFLPLFEAFTRITTNQTLLELADLNRPLLKRLSLEASGTYAHSINVANLAEAAARSISANPLLARVGAYYHDVGKMAAPQYFIENQARGRNPHDHMDPRRSAALVRAHVVEGMKMAEEAKLPDTVRAFIPEHHGSQLIGFFFDQAQQSNPEAELDPADFSYPGPRPRTPETAILMLADSVESAAKALQEPTPERIRELVDRIVDVKINQGQLDEAPLTMRDIARIKEQFAAVLGGMYHHRIDYPPARPAAPSAPAAAPPDPAAAPSGGAAAPTGGAAAPRGGA